MRIWVIFVALAGLNLLSATAHTKLLNFASNAGALMVFIFMDIVDWRLGLSMALGQILGAYCGTHLAVLIGPKLIRPVLILVSLAMSIKLILDQIA